MKEIKAFNYVIFGNGKKESHSLFKGDFVKKLKITKEC